jgi:transposase, IS5 family
MEIMVRRRHAQLTLSQVVLFGMVVPEPEALMEPWLRAVDKALDDEDMLEAVVGIMRRRWDQSARRGRMGTPAEVVLRMLALKHLRDWSYDELEREVTGSLVYRRFCRIDAGKVPDAKTMVRLGQVVDGQVSPPVWRGPTSTGITGTRAPSVKVAAWPIRVEARA